jgi:hypothetical protein
MEIAPVAALSVIVPAAPMSTSAVGTTEHRGAMATAEPTGVGAGRHRRSFLVLVPT